MIFDQPDRPPECKYMQIVDDEIAPYVYAIDAHYVKDTVSLTYFVGVKQRTMGKIHLVDGKWTYSLSLYSQVGLIVSRDTFLSHLKDKVK